MHFNSYLQFQVPALSCFLRLAACGLWLGLNYYFFLYPGAVIERAFYDTAAQDNGMRRNILS